MATQSNNPSPFPGRRSAFVSSSRAQTRDPRTSEAVRAGLQGDPGRVDSRLRGNDDNEGGGNQRNLDGA